MTSFIIYMLISGLFIGVIKGKGATAPFFNYFGACDLP